ncbi:MAG: Gfo/Idh/MocA family protein, partial [Actinomycetes bacterium]
MADLRVGLIGLGMMGRHHARVVRELEGVQLVAVADAFGDPHGVAGDLPLCGSVDELISQGIDMAVCAVPTGLHEEVGLALAAAGAHTMVEKPIASTIEGGVKLAEAFEAAGLEVIPAPTAWLGGGEDDTAGDQSLALFPSQNTAY